MTETINLFNAENDIYNNAQKYRSFVEGIEGYLEPPKGKRKYQIKNPENITHFKRLFAKFAARDCSYIRRLRLSRTLLIVTHILNKNLKDTNREDIERVVSFAMERNKSQKSKKDFVIDLKFLYKLLFPDQDEKGRDDETIMPYVIRNLKYKIDRSTEKARKDRFSIADFEKLVSSFGDEPQMQAILTLAFESLGRPQELLYLKRKDIKLYDNYAVIELSEHGKEGIGILRCIESYPYVSKWYNNHPLKKDDAFFFLIPGNKNKYRQLKPMVINHKLKTKCALLNIPEITMYSLKRNGVTFRRLRGDSDLDIQKTARWTTTKQLHTYDMSGQEESYKIELIKKGIIKLDKDKKPEEFERYKHFAPSNNLKECIFCKTKNGIGESICSNCKRPLDREVIEQEVKNKDIKIEQLEKEMQHILKIFKALELEKKAPNAKRT